MESSDVPFNSKISADMPETQASKKQKICQKSVVAVKIDENDYEKKQKSEGPPSDCWSWRKYGQKPIKGSPYPRGYYKCSTSKSCSAKKQVERCKTDTSLLIITYTSTHNHPSPKEPKQIEDPKQEKPKIQITGNKEEDQQEEDEKDQEKITSTQNMIEFQYCQSPFTYSSDHQDIISNLKHEEEDGLISPFTEKLESLVFDVKLEKPLCYPHLMTFSTPTNEENDFYEELGELPISSSLTRFMRSNFFEDKILIQ